MSVVVEGVGIVVPVEPVAGVAKVNTSTSSHLKNSPAAIPVGGFREPGTHCSQESPNICSICCDVIFYFKELCHKRQKLPPKISDFRSATSVLT